VQLAQSGLGESKKGRERTKLPEANLPTLINTMGWFFYTERKPKVRICSACAIACAVVRVRWCAR